MSPTRRFFRAGVVCLAGVLYKAVEPGSHQHLLQEVVEHVTRRTRHLGPHHHQIALTIVLPTHRHSQTPTRSLREIESDRAHFVNGLLNRVWFESGSSRWVG